MSDILFSLHSWPQAIVHIDGDAFFTSCEEAIHPVFRGKPLVTGSERGIVACASYPAKIGIKRGVSLHEAKRICPGLIVLPSDYETYSLFPGACSASCGGSPIRWKSIPSTRLLPISWM
jgi:hypothetical protein